MSKILLYSRRLALPSMTVSITALAMGAALAEPPPADTVIGNQAAATYISNGEEVVIQSNLVETTVNEVFGLSLTASQDRSGAPGGFVFFPHTLTNNGNAADRFSVAIAAAAGADDFLPTDITVFADADQNGVPDNQTPITLTPEILAGDAFGVVVRAIVPAAVASGEVTDFGLVATSTSDATQTETNTDTLTISTSGIIDLQKDQTLSVDADANGAISVGDTIEVNLSYSNTGIGAASNVILQDILPTTNSDGDAIVLTYVPGSGVWSDAPGTVLTDAPGNVEATNAQLDTISYEFAGPLTVRATLDNVPAGRSGSVRFSYVITEAPEGGYENIASVTTDTQTETQTNGSVVEVAPAAALTFADAAGTAALATGTPDAAGNLDAANASTTDADGALNDTVEDSSTIFAGDAIAFDFVLTNLGNGTDTFSLAVDADAFPPGTIFNLVSADGVTPIIGDEVTLAAGEARHVQLVATLLVGTPPTTGAAGFDAVISAVSQTDPDVSNTTRAVFNGMVLAPTLDLANTVGGDPVAETGVGPFVTEQTDPGTQVTFPLQVTVAAGSPANTFDLTASNLPAGWSVEFFTLDGTPITNTGALIPGDGTDAEFDYIAVVTIPEDAPAVLENVTFTATSPSNGATDSILNAVEVNEIVDLAIAGNAQAQSAPGGVAVLAHTITNLGNSDIVGGALILGGTDPFTDQGVTAAVFYDANENGVLDATDPVITDISDIVGADGVAGLSPEETARVFVRAQVPSTTGFGLQETGDLAITDALTTVNGAATDSDLSNNMVVDTITVVSGDISFTKQQAIDVSCDGVLDSAFSGATLSADPGDCLAYRIQADNTGFSNATDIVIRDAVPTFTTIETCTADACLASLDVDGVTTAIPVLPADEASGLVATSATQDGFTLAPGARAVLIFTVQIDE